MYIHHSIAPEHHRFWNGDHRMTMSSHFLVLDVLFTDVFGDCQHNEGTCSSQGYAFFRTICSQFSSRSEACIQASSICHPVKSIESLCWLIIITLFAPNSLVFFGLQLSYSSRIALVQLSYSSCNSCKISCKCTCMTFYRASYFHICCMLELVFFQMK